MIYKQKMLSTTNWLLLYFGIALQCDFSLLEALHCALPPTSRDILNKLPNVSSIEDTRNSLIDILEQLKGWKYEISWNGIKAFPSNFVFGSLAYIGQLQIMCTSLSATFYEFHNSDPHMFIQIEYDPRGNLLSADLRSFHSGFFENIDNFTDHLLKIKSLKDQLLFANVHLYKLVGYY